MITREPNSLEQSAVATLLYFDVFNHPLTVEEVHAFLPQNSVTVDDVRSAIHDSPLIDRHASEPTELVVVRGRSAEWIPRRRQKERYAVTLWRRARIVAHLIAMFPFVRGLFVSGSLSKNTPDSKADVDWFIVTEPGRLYICKTILTAFRRIFLFNQTKYFCTNYYVSSNALEIPDKNVFIATEVATARPVLSTELAGRFFSENAWIRDYLPNVSAPDTSMVIQAPIASAVRRALETMFRGAVGDWLERRCFALHDRFERRKNKHLPPEDYHIMYRATPVECKIHHHNFQRRVLEAYSERLAEFGVSRKINDVRD